MSVPGVAGTSRQQRPAPADRRSGQRQHDEASEHALNAKIVESTLLMAELEGGMPMLLQAWTPFAEVTVRSHSSGDVFGTYVEQVRQGTASISIS